MEFLEALRDPDVPFLRYALLIGLLASVSFGVMGTYVVARRISYIAGAISHSILGGLGAAFFFHVRFGLEWLHPLHGAVAAALLSAVIIGLVTLYGREREDTVIGIVWVLGMSVGLIFIAKTPGYVDLTSYLFGNILLISKSDLWLVAGLDVVVVALAALFHNQLLAVCFDEEFARLRGVRVEFYYMLLLCLTALTVVLLVSVVGIVLVIALLTLPAAAAAGFSRRLWHMMALGVVFCMVFTTAGLACSYTLELPSGPTIILFAVPVYLAGAAYGKRRAS